MQNYLSDLATDNTRRNEFAQSVGLPPPPRGASSVSPEALTAAFERNRAPFQAAYGLENRPTQFTDYFMLRYYGVTPRENYLNSTIVPEPQNQGIPSNSPVPTPLENAPIHLRAKLATPLDTPAVAEEALEYDATVRGMTGLPTLPPQTSGGKPNRAPAL